MSRGLPIVITELLASQLEIADPAVMVANDPRSFAEAVCRLYADEALWLRARQAGWQIVGKDCNRAGFLEELRALCDPVELRAVS